MSACRHSLPVPTFADMSAFVGRCPHVGAMTLRCPAGWTVIGVSRDIFVDSRWWSDREVALGARHWHGHLYPGEALTLLLDQAMADATTAVDATKVSACRSGSKEYDASWRIGMNSSKISDEAYVRSDLSHLAKMTKRYAICHCGQGGLKVFDKRQLFDSLLQWQAILPFDESTGISDWKVLRRQLSAGPNLTEADDEAFTWLSTNAEVQDDVAMARHYSELFRAATVCEGTEAGIRRFLLAKLWWHL
jgi:hypothetical protein